MINLKEETIEAIIESKHTIEDIDYCRIDNRDGWEEYSSLCNGDICLDKIDITYDGGYGSQEIYGFIVFKDGSWLERGEYDGSEWWEYKSKPTLEGNKND